MLELISPFSPIISSKCTSGLLGQSLPISLTLPMKRTIQHSEGAQPCEKNQDSRKPHQLPQLWLPGGTPALSPGQLRYFGLLPEVGITNDRTCQPPSPLPYSTPCENITHLQLWQRGRDLRNIKLSKYNESGDRATTAPRKGRQRRAQLSPTQTACVSLWMQSRLLSVQARGQKVREIRELNRKQLPQQ